MTSTAACSHRYGSRQPEVVGRPSTSVCREAKIEALVRSGDRLAPDRQRRAAAGKPVKGRRTRTPTRSTRCEHEPPKSRTASTEAPPPRRLRPLRPSPPPALPRVRRTTADDTAPSASDGPCYQPG